MCSPECFEEWHARTQAQAAVGSASDSNSDLDLPTVLRQPPRRAAKRTAARITPSSSGSDPVVQPDEPASASLYQLPRLARLAAKRTAEEMEFSSCGSDSPDCPPTPEPVEPAENEGFYEEPLDPSAGGPLATAAATATAPVTATPPATATATTT